MYSVTPARFFLTSLELRNFRCFSHFSLNLEGSITLIEGANGTGKTSLLEALYYSCYLRSFRSAFPTELVKTGETSFFIKALITRLESTIDNNSDSDIDIDNTSAVSRDTKDNKSDNSIDSSYGVSADTGSFTNNRDSSNAISFKHEIQTAFTRGKRVIKIDQRRISSYKELMEFIRVISVTDDDVSVVRGSPQDRRSFLDRALLLHDPDYSDVLRDFRTILQNRNALLNGESGKPWNKDTYYVLTEQLWNQSRKLSQLRKSLLESIADCVHKMARTYLPGPISIEFLYDPGVLRHETFDQFFAGSGRLEQRERVMGRSLFGAHLDDFSITFQNSKSRSHSSRGQQKLVLLLLKIGQAYHLAHTKLVTPILVLDDFMTDFDLPTATALLNSLKALSGQLIFTSPARDGVLATEVRNMGGQILALQ